MNPPAQPSQQNNQKEFQKCLDDMMRSFQDFYTQMSKLQQEQRKVVEHIYRSVDQQKIDQIKQLLTQAQQYNSRSASSKQQ